jgi:hypothetical protein
MFLYEAVDMMRNYRSVDRASLHPSMTHVKLQKDDCMPHDMLNSIAQRRNTTTNTYGRLEDESRFPTKRNSGRKSHCNGKSIKTLTPTNQTTWKSVKNRRTTPADT